MISLNHIDQRERKKQQGQDATFYSSCCQQAQSLGAQLREGQKPQRGVLR